MVQAEPAATLPGITAPTNVLGRHAALHRELDAIPVRVENDALIVTIASATRPVLDCHPSPTQSSCELVDSTFRAKREREMS